MMNSKIKAGHLSRKAIVYLRQSSPGQVKHNTESQRLQYDLAHRARELGWNQVEMVDSDLGSAASIGAAERRGYEHTIGQIAMGKVGIVLSRELSRLSRTDKDFCQLMEACVVFDTLVADDEQVYDLSLMDDQLVMGIKATLSVVELKVLQQRLIQGQESKARRGELYRIIPPGYVLDPEGKQVVKDPNERVRRAIELVFKKYNELWSIRQTFLWFHNEGIELPVNRCTEGPRELIWKLPAQSLVGSILRNPFYGGAYCYGRRQVEFSFVDGRLVKREKGRLPYDQARVFIRDHHEGYISWERFEENQRRMRGNALKTNSEGEDSVGAVRSGHGLLSGLLRCRRCGRKLHVRYWGRHGTAARYLCQGDFGSGGRYCLGFGGATVDRRFSEELLKVLSPLGLEASVEATKRLEKQGDARRRALELQLEQLEYEARRAFEQYDEADARNRLVASELERRWNEKLEEVEQVKATLSELKESKPSLSEETRATIAELGRDFSKVWQSVDCPTSLKKRIIRTVVEEILVDLDDETALLHFVIHWKGGSHSGFEMAKPRSGAGRKTSMDDVDLIGEMSSRGYNDDEIARVLSKLGRRTGQGNRWNRHRVEGCRKRYGKKRGTKDANKLTLAEAASYCGVSNTTISKLVERGLLKKEQVAPWAPWEIERSDLDTEPVRGIIDHLIETGKLVLKPRKDSRQKSLFDMNEDEDTNRKTG
jgi:DNA invertase Pin-like site-specific DNA recombinase